MALRSCGKDNADLVRQLQDRGIIKSQTIAKAMLATDRKFYSTLNPYMDAPQSIGFGVTISAPHMHAYALELLKDKLLPNARILDIGSGSGYLTACFARYLDGAEEAHQGKVIGIEHQPDLVELGFRNMREDDSILINSGRVTVIQGDGRLGCREYAPYDAIHVGAASPEIPQELINQLKPKGRLIVPVGPKGGTQYLEQFDKNENGEVSKTRLMAVMFGPLTDLKHT